MLIVTYAKQMETCQTYRLNLTPYLRYIMRSYKDINFQLCCMGYPGDLGSALSKNNPSVLYPKGSFYIVGICTC